MPEVSTAVVAVRPRVVGWVGFLRFSLPEEDIESTTVAGYSSCNVLFLRLFLVLLFCNCDKNSSRTIRVGGGLEAPYELNADNKFLELENPFEEGVRLFEEGQIADAALCFEAEIARNPENSQVSHNIDLISCDTKYM